MSTKRKALAPKPASVDAQILLALSNLADQVSKLAGRLEKPRTAIDEITQDYQRRIYERYVAPEPARPTLKWTIALTSEINWIIRCDPEAFIPLKSGAVIDIDRDCWLAFRGYRIGTVSQASDTIIQGHRNAGAKFHAFLTTDRRVTVKVGYPI